MKPEQQAALRVPFPKSAIGKLPKGNTMLDYVGHAAVTDRLLAVDPEWSWEPVAWDEAGLPRFDQRGGLWIRLTIAGVTRLGYGDGPDPKQRIGDAIRNAAMRFGVALDLWAKEDIQSTTPPVGVDVSTGEIHETPGTVGGGEAPTVPRNRAGNRDNNDPATSNDGLWKALQASLAQWQKSNDASRADVLLFVASVLDREVSSTKELSVNDAHRVLDALGRAS